MLPAEKLLDSRINDTASYSCSLYEAELLSSLLAQTLSNWLTGSENKSVLSWNTSKLVKVVRDHVLEACMSVTPSTFLKIGKKGLTNLVEEPG
jgi:hypothetical protein